MQAIIKGLLIGMLLVSCAGKDSRYRDTELLERPPTLAVEKGIYEQTIEPDESVIPKKSDKLGLGSDVYLVESKPLQLKIKRSFDDSWRSLGLALKQNHIKITDHDHEKGLYYVYYSPKGLFQNAVTWFQDEKEDEHHDANFLLKIEPESGEIKITATPINGAGLSSSSDNEGDYGSSVTTDEEDLLHNLYYTLHDDLKEE